MRIWNYKLLVTDEQVLGMPEGADILTVQTQDEWPCLWALCDETAPKVIRKFAIYGTGNPMPDQPGKYIGTFQIQGSMLVFHVFEIEKEGEAE